MALPPNARTGSAFSRPAPGARIDDDPGGPTISTTATHYQHLEPRPGSSYRQLFLKGRQIRAAVVYEAVHGLDRYTPEEFAREYDVLLEAVLEALVYVADNLPLIEGEPEREAADIRARGLDRPPRPRGC